MKVGQETKNTLLIYFDFFFGGGGVKKKREFQRDIKET